MNGLPRWMPIRANKLTRPVWPIKRGSCAETTDFLQQQRFPLCEDGGLSVRTRWPDDGNIVRKVCGQ